MRKTLIAFGLGAALVTSACTTTTNEAVGTGTGTVIGALAGAALGRETSGRLAGAAIGGLVGAYIGNRIGAALDRRDRELARANARQAMTYGNTGGSYAWRNPRTGNRGIVTPTSIPYRAAGGEANGRICRNFSEKVQLADGKSETVVGRRCRTADDGWEIVG